MTYLKTLAAVIFILSFSIIQVNAGILMVSSDNSLQGTGKASIIKTYMEKNKMRVESGENEVVIYHQDKGIFWAINNREKTYTEMTRADIKAMKSRMDEARKRMRDQMKDLPPEQRQMVEEMMKGKMQSQPAKTTFKKVQSKVKVNQWITDKYEGHRQGSLEKEVWSADMSELGLDSDSLNVMTGLSDFFKELFPDSNAVLKPGSKEWEKEMGYAGIPVKSIDYNNGQKTGVMEIKEIHKQDFPASLFEIPAGYTKTTNPQMR